MKIDAPSNDYVVMNDIQSSSRGESVKPGFTVISNYDAELCVVCAVKRYIDCVGVLQLKSTPACGASSCSDWIQAFLGKTISQCIFYCLHNTELSHWIMEIVVVV